MFTSIGPINAAAALTGGWFTVAANTAQRAGNDSIEFWSAEKMLESGNKLPLPEAEQLAEIRDAIETALATESLRDSVVTREIADILGLPHGGPQPGNFVGRARKNLADKGYNCLKTPEGLHPNTVTLVLQFAGALAEKLKAAQDKYGYSNGWMDPSWMDECRAKLREHLEKGDPRDVAAYCAFLWHHGEPTTSETLQSEDAMRHAIIGGLSLATDENGLNRKSYGEIADVILNEIAKSRSLNENRATVQALPVPQVRALVAQWRKQALHLHATMRVARAAELRQCADELEGALNGK